ncbi:MAG: hypothetical protein BGO14_09980 [Chlamydiales bacterium 38-26]|nr:hypothetical protein [Chlamydiales bacterium]OJV11296.1 MAG: hypothetical protein BGO14_09980 [Chlamydiales bacterium 38-26]
MGSTLSLSPNHSTSEESLHLSLISAQSTETILKNKELFWALFCHLASQHLKKNDFSVRLKNRKLVISGSEKTRTSLIKYTERLQNFFCKIWSLNVAEADIHMKSQGYKNGDKVYLKCGSQKIRVKRYIYEEFFYPLFDSLVANLGGKLQREREKLHIFFHDEKVQSIYQKDVLISSTQENSWEEDGTSRKRSYTKLNLSGIQEESKEKI